MCSRVYGPRGSLTPYANADAAHEGRWYSPWFWRNLLWLDSRANRLRSRGWGVAFAHSSAHLCALSVQRTQRFSGREGGSSGMPTFGRQSKADSQCTMNYVYAWVAALSVIADSTLINCVSSEFETKLSIKMRRRFVRCNCSLFIPPPSRNPTNQKANYGREGVTPLRDGLSRQNEVGQDAYD